MIHKIHHHIHKRLRHTPRINKFIIALILLCFVIILFLGINFKEDHLKVMSEKFIMDDYPYKNYTGHDLRFQYIEDIQSKDCKECYNIVYNFSITPSSDLENITGFKLVLYIEDQKIVGSKYTGIG